MNSTTFSPTAAPASTPAAARTALRMLEKMRHGSLALQLPDASVRHFGKSAHATAAAHPAATMTWHNWSVCSAALKSGDVGFAESYIAGDWSTSDITALLRLFIRNRNDIEAVIYGSWAGRVMLRAKHWLNRNTRANSKKNVHAHYDLGNAFYSLWLDETMNYSAGWFEGDHQRPVREAQWAKVRRALRMANVRRGDRVLEVGCGWGALAELAVVEFGATIAGVTLSTEQLAYAQRRMLSLGLTCGAGQQADLRLQDYRDIQDGPYDAICSIEMVEAVGQAYWPSYFAQINRLLRPGGRACIQSIVIDDALFDRYVSSTDFIQQYIFPGGCLPCPREFRRAARAGGLEVVDELAFGQDYAHTLRQWRHTFLQQRAQVLRLGFDERFVRIWEFYLAYCEAAFDEGNIQLVQYTLAKPGL